MRRRTFAIGVLGVVASPLTSWAQKLMPKIGFLGSGAPDSSAIFVDALRGGLQEHGLLEGRDYAFDFGWVNGDYRKFDALAERMVMNGDAVILATTIAAVKAAQRASSTTPIVMTSIIDPVGAGLIKSLSRPGGNTTGMSNLAEDVTPKLLDFMTEALPHLERLGILLNPENPGSKAIFEKIKRLLKDGSIHVHGSETKLPEDLTRAFEEFKREDVQAAIISPDFMFIDRRAVVASLARSNAIPLITSIPEYTDAGALLSYGTPRRVTYRRTAYYIRRILDGATPSELPVEQPTEIELSLNLRIARELNLALPERLTSRADRVIE